MDRRPALLPPQPVLREPVLGGSFVVVAFNPGRQRSVSAGDHRLADPIEFPSEVEQVGVELSAGGLKFLAGEEEGRVGACAREKRGVGEGESVSQSC